MGVEAVALTHQLREVTDSGVLATELARLRGLASNKVGGVVSFDVVDLCAAIVELRLRQGEAVSLDASAGVTVRTIPDDLTEVLGNLLDNASRHAPRSPVTLRARAEQGDIKISVLDRGPGVPADVVQKIFDRGFTTHPSGSGLGLYISREIVRRLGGDLTVAKRVGGGTEFAVVLPHFAATPNGDVGEQGCGLACFRGTRVKLRLTGRAEVDDMRAEVQAVRIVRDTVGAESVLGKPLQSSERQGLLDVLLVDDHPLLQLGLHSSLHELGVRSAMADVSSREALLAQVADERPTAVVLDDGLPALGDGLGLSARSCRSVVESWS